MFVISRIEQYKFSDCGAVFAESERKLARYDNPDWDPEKVSDNVHFLTPSFSGSLEDHILARKSEYKCRLSIDPALPLDKQTNCFCQAIFTASPVVFQLLSSDETIDFFKNCFAFFQSYLPDSVEFISATIHMDESTPHMHINFLPFIRKENSRGKLKTVFSSSDLFSGKDYFVRYQDDFYAYMRELYPEFPFERKGEVHQDHLSIREYKQVQSDISQAKNECAYLNSVIGESKSVVEEIEQIDELGSEPVFGSKWKIDFSALNYLKSAAKNYFASLLDFRKLQREKEELEIRLQKVETDRVKLLRDKIALTKENQSLKYQTSFLLRFIEEIKKLKEWHDFWNSVNRDIKYHDRMSR